MKHTVISVALIIVIGFAVYGNSIKGEFIWDDKRIVEENTLIRDWSNIPRTFTQDVGKELAPGGGGVKYNFYRPLQILTYMMDYSLWKLDVRGYHLTNILLHIFAALAMFWFINVICGDHALSLVASLLFLAHPVHTEAVSYISGRADPLSLSLTLLCFIFYVRSIDSQNKFFYIFMLLSYALAILARENSLILPALILVYHYAFSGSSGKKIKLGHYLPIIGITVVYIILRLTMARELLGGERIPVGVLFQRMPGFFVAITNYVRLLFLPFDLHMEYGNSFFQMSNPKAIAGAAILFFLFAYAIRKRRGDGLASFSILWFLVALLPSSNLYPIGAYMAEHWLYLPSLGFFLILAGVIRKKNLLCFFSIIALIVFYSVLTVRQNSYWRELIPFYERTLKYAPESARLHNNLGVAYHNIGRYEEAKAAYEKSIAIDPNYLETFCNLGTAYHDLGRYDEAITAYNREITINPSYPKVYNNLGAAYSDIGEYEEAAASYKKAIGLDPKKVEMYCNLGFVYYKLGRYKEAIGLYKKAVAVDPNYVKAHNDLGMVYHGDGDYEKAIAAYEKAMEIEPASAEIYFNLGIAYEVIGRRRDAIGVYRRAIAADPDYAAAHNNLAILYFREKEYTLAGKHCDRAVELGYDVAPVFLKDLKEYRE